MTSTRYPTIYFAHLSEEEAQDLDAFVEEAGRKKGVSSDILASARRKRSEEGKHAMSLEELGAYRLFKKAYHQWTVARGR